MSSDREIEIPDGVIILEPQRHLNKAIIGLSDDKLVYSYGLLIDVFMDMNMTYHEAVEHIEYNIICYGITGWPVIMDDLHE